MSEGESKDTHGALGTPWYGFDLDGTLAYYDHWRNFCHIGAPIPKMVERIKKFHDEGKLVKVLTARVAPKAADPKKPGGGTPQECRDVIAKWCKKHLGFVPEITHEKDHLMLELYDDRVKQVMPNTGVLVEDELKRVTEENLRQYSEIVALKREKAYARPVVSKDELLKALNEIAEQVYLRRYAGALKEDYFLREDISEDNAMSFTITFSRCDSDTVMGRIRKLVRLAEKKYGITSERHSSLEVENLTEELTGSKYRMATWYFSPNAVEDPDGEDGE